MRRALAAALLAFAAPAAAQPRPAPAGAQSRPAPAGAQSRILTSAAPQRIAVTVYRAPYGRGPMDLRYLGGFALVSEMRRIALPRGPATLRFEGVADGIVPASAVIEGLPGGTVEKNRDARLLSPAALVDGTLGRQVTLTRTDRATGKATSEQATIVAGPAPGVVLRTRAGIETLRCSGLPERLAYDRVPADLSAKPVLSVATVSPAARTVTVRLSYLSSAFDWRASYVATLGEGGTLDLFGWLTLANANAGALPDAEVSAVAGRLNRVFTPAMEAAVGALSLRCYPLGTTTSDLRVETFELAEEIVVTAFRTVAAPPPVMMAPAPPPPPPPPPPPEDLGDLKLYRVPERVTVAARGQKQVALLARDGVAFERRYRLAVEAGTTRPAAPTAIVLVVRNRKEDGLGIALPAGGTALYARRGEDRLLLGLGTLEDRAEGETIRIAAGTSAQVQVEQVATAAREARLIATNATRVAARLEVPIGAAGQRIISADPALAPVDGIATWSVSLPPGGRATLDYRLPTP